MKLPGTVLVNKFHCQWTRLLLTFTVSMVLFLPQPAHGQNANLAQEFYIAEESDIGVVIGRVGEGIPNAQPPYSTYFDNEDMEEDLEVTNEGVIKVKGRIDRESRSTYRLVAISQRGVHISITIHITDINDNTPTFPPSPVILTLLESAPMDAKYFLGSAVDADLGNFSTARYELVEGNTDDAFRLLTKRASNGVLLLDLAINGHLDYETTPFYHLHILAYDGGDPPNVGQLVVNITIVDANDNQPIFNHTRYFAQVPENSTVGTSILQVYATDVDSGENGRISYHIDRPRSDPDENFRINSDSGIIFVNRELDYETRQNYELIVVAKDNGTQKLQTTAIVSVQVKDVNDNRPVIDLIFLTVDGTGRISETAQPGDFVARISVSDPDGDDQSPTINVTLAGGNGYFGLTTRDNIVYLVILSQPLDREVSSNYVLTVYATDSGIPPLQSTRSFTVYITDTNDNAPTFPQKTYYAEIQEVVPIGTSVIQLQAVDHDLGNNSVISYRILRTPDSHWEWFQIDNRTGLITTRTLVDCETSDEPQLEVVATDSGSPPLSATATVVVRIINVNDNQPVFDQSFYNVTVPEDIRVGSCVLQLSASDPDCGAATALRYAIADNVGFQNPTEWLVRQGTGEVCIAQPLDFDTTTSYTFSVVARDQDDLDTTALVMIVIEDVNDNLPVFYPSQYSVSLDADTARVQDQVVVVQAIDADSGNFGSVTYSIIQGNVGQVFAIEANTGVVSIADDVPRQPSVYTLMVRAIDGGGRSSNADATVTISIRDSSQNPPEFSLSLYRFSIPEDATEGDVVGVVEASNENQDAVIYSIISGDTNKMFTINANTGQLRTNKPLDHDTLPSVLLNIQAQASSPPAYANAQVNVTIADVNDNWPVFMVSSVELPVKENMANNSPLYVARASDIDSGDNGKVRYTMLDPTNTFHVDSVSGEVRLMKALDYEVITTYQLTIQAGDLGADSHESTMNVVVMVQDVNDNLPVFSKDLYEFNIWESATENTKFGAVLANDLDSGNNGRVRYFIQNGQNVERFGVFSDDGFLYNRVRLDRERQDLYGFTIIGVDNGIPPLSSSASIVVHVLDINDNDPVFGEPVYSFFIAENQPPHSYLGFVSATDRDTSSQLNYAIVGSSLDFSIDGQSGELVTNRQLDREQQEIHELSVMVSDQNAPPLRSAVVEVRVTVLDINDNSPRFERTGVYEASINENQPKGTLVAQVSASDSDKGANQSITYSFVNDPGNHDSSMFILHPRTGHITTNEVLDHESKAAYILRVRAQDGGMPPRGSVQTVEVLVEDQNETPPEFENAQAAFEVRESTVPGVVIGSVTALDRDSGENAKVRYYIVRGNLFGTFAVNATTGAIIVSRPVDYEECSSYEIQIRAIDSSAVNPMSSIINVNITIEDLNDNAPVFEENPVMISIRENIPADTHIYTFTALDADSGLRGKVHFSILSQSPVGDWFSIDSDTGYLRIATPIDYEATSEISIVVQAEDRVLPLRDRLSTTVSALILIEDINDNVPVFDSRPSVDVFEDEPVSYPVMHVAASDADSFDRGRVAYSLISGNEKGHFNLHQNTGLLTIARLLNREEQAMYLLNVSAHDYGHPRQVSYMLLTVHVIDVNDNPPAFEHSVYTATISENEVEGTLVRVVRATDKDTGVNAELTYLIPDGIASNQFVIGEKNGEVRTAVVLDREEQSSWIITAYVRDGAFPALFDTTTILVQVADVNDNSPTFKISSVDLEVPENAHLSVIHTVIATDADAGENGRILYSIVGGNPGNKFTIDGSKGQLSCLPLDRETVPLYNLTIQASDAGSPARTSLSSIIINVLDDNDNDPEFGKAEYTDSIPENTVSGTPVVRVQATDLDIGVNAMVTYSINNASQGQFIINNVTGFISTAGEFDREKTEVYSFEVHATDGGLYGPRSTRVRVQITILDINDNAPIFTQIPFRAEISQNLGLNQRVLQVEAVDKDSGDNGQVIYSFSPTSQYFHMNAATGEVTTKSVLDLSAVRIHRLEVIARDQADTPLSSTGLVEITVGNAGDGGSTLRFTNLTYNVYVVENAAFSASITRVQARFSDQSVSGRITYSFASGNEESIFNINADNGLITVQDGSKLDYESNRRLRLIVVATANSAYGYTTVWVNLKDVNDNSPHFTQERYTSSVWEGNSRDTFVTQIMATDLDEGKNGEVTYSIISGNLHDAFVIDPPNTGIVKTNVILDREILDAYRLEIEAIDGGNNPLTSSCILKIQIIDINDNAPFFPSYPPVNIREGTEVGTMVLQVTANDVDLNPNLNYEFASGGNPSEAFSIDRYSGRISVARSLDHEITSRYNLRVMSSDTSHNATADITVNILDENDNAPTFSQQSYQVTIPEMTGPDYSVITVNATDRDSGDNAKITYSMITVSGFYIDPQSGTVNTNETVQFNPSQPLIHLVVTASDHGRPERFTAVAVRVQVLDINNHRPVFLPVSYSGSVSEDAEPGLTLQTVTATDNDDMQENKKIDYSIIRGDEEKMFQMLSSTGEIILIGTLDRERRASYQLEVMAIDRGSPPLNSTAMVTVTVLDVNDNSPVFNSSEYKTEVRENATIAAHVLTVFASDIDANENGRIEFKIASGNDDNKFEIDRDTGVVSVRISLDHETQDIHRLIISATDSSTAFPRHSAFATILINVTDVNEYAPAFPHKLYFERVQEKLSVGSFVFNIRANDKDSGVFGIVEYQIVTGNTSEQGHFTIDRHTGDVTTAAVFYHNVKAFYQFSVVAIDSGMLSETAHVVVNIEAQADIRPIFAKESYSFEVPGNALAGYLVGQVRALDQNQVYSGLIFYNLKEQNDYFAINRTTGVIFVQNDLQDSTKTENDMNTRKRRFISRLSPDQFRQAIGVRQKRALSVSSVSLVIVASSNIPGGFEAETSIMITVNRSCTGCAQAATGGDGGGGLSVTALVLLVVFLTLAAILIAVIVVVYIRGRERKRHPPASHYNSNSFTNVSIPPPPPVHVGFSPPAYNDVDYPHLHNTTSEMSEQSQSASSGRGSVEDDDEEIQMINSVPQDTQGLRGMPDSGIQQDDDAISEHSVHNHQEYLARLGIDAATINCQVNNKTAMAAPSVESMHHFSDEGGGEGLDLDQVGYRVNNTVESKPHKATITSEKFSGIGDSEQSTAGSLSSVINSEEEFSGSYNWDYLLDWGPQYQPLADVFNEIARLKDDNIKPKTKPTQIVPQRPTMGRAFQPPPSQSSRNLPPPMITDMPPKAVPVTAPLALPDPSHHHLPMVPLSNSSHYSNNTLNSARTSQLTSVSLPKSPISYDSSFTSAMTPSFTPSLSPLATRSPSISPLVSPKGIASSGHSSSGQETPQRKDHNGLVIAPGSSGSEQEIQI